MKPAPIQITDYFIIDLHLSANPKFDTKKDVPMDFADYKVAFEANQNKEDKQDWQLGLKLQFQPPAEANVPYRFSADMVGFAVVHPSIKPELVERIVRTNGASMMFGALREIIRDATARGPYPPMLLPSTSFYEPKDKTAEQTENKPPAK